MHRFSFDAPHYQGINTINVLEIEFQIDFWMHLCQSPCVSAFFNPLIKVFSTYMETLRKIESKNSL